MTRQGRISISHIMALSSQALLAVFVMLAAVFWPRAGEAAMLVPIGERQSADALQWLEQEQTSLLSFDARGGAFIAIVPSNISVLRAVKMGLLPIAADGAICRSDPPREVNNDNE